MSLRVLQRSCACGGTPGPTGECAQCRARRLAQEAVQRTLQAPARPLDTATRATFEAAWGHDFSGVRIHADEDAFRSAEAVGARAYTVGRDVVFGRGRYDPTSEAGTRLLSHELTHVRQQGGAPASGPVVLRDDPAAEAEAERAPTAVAHRVPAALQREEDEPPATEPGVDVGASPTPAQAPPAAAAPAVCEPARALTWADFAGTPPAGTTLSAFTGVRWREGSTGFRALVDTASCWVLPGVRGAGTRATNGCAPEVRDCQRVFDGLAPGSTATVPRGTATGCPAAVFTAASANTRAECETVIGAACDPDARSESTRLLGHEQLHFDIGCALVRRANAAAGRPRADVRTWLDANFQPQQDAYDHDTDNGCIAAQQAAWATRVAGGLAAVPGP